MQTDETILAEAVPARPTGRPLHLVRRGDAEVLRGHAGRFVRPLSGILWVTHENEPRDVVLKAGEGYLVPDDGRVVLNAFRTSLIEIV